MCIHIAYNCIANVDLLRSFGASLPCKSKQTKLKHGPPVTSVKIKLYNLPEGSKLPRFNNCPKTGIDPLLIKHMNVGYGKKLMKGDNKTARSND